MYNAELTLRYSIGVFIVVLISSCVLNLLKHHFIYQLTGIAFFFTLVIFRIAAIFRSDLNAAPGELYFTALPMLTGISACLISMVLGFWIFPPIRKRLKA